jgi:hypothetical protein
MKFSILLLESAGFSPWLMAGEERIAFEGNLVRTKIALEDAFYAIAKASRCCTLSFLHSLSLSLSLLSLSLSFSFSFQLFHFISMFS